MARVTESLCFWMTMLSVLVVSLVLAQNGHRFVHYDFRNADLYIDGTASTEDGRLRLTDSSKRSTGHAFHQKPIHFRNISSSFSTEFVFAIIPKQRDSNGQGMAFVVSPTIDLRYGASGSYLGIFNKTSDNQTKNHILAVEFDTNPSSEAININSIVSVKSENASYYDDTTRRNITLLLASKQRIHVWIDYDAEKRLLVVTIAPLNTAKPSSPLLSLPIDLSKIFKEQMYFGFSGSTGVIRSHQYILGWALAIGEKAQSLDISKILDLPQPAPSSPALTKAQVITISIISVLVFLMLPSGILYHYFRKKYAEVFEQWEQLL
ncbi:unnamed protein product [Arabidopsis lyrata]|uniref:putative L-type lectin-domain containing receptor kinase II.2 n=1 Tax=Arabidopsis lyrata subsp. lyrata TaxID=81972 RepID=UPI000A29DEA3|nr:putative L-type lectin-domain containing receptor kinase II.2 [Arabidopsis lyrata subsp. lyrata]CAH8267685.1 unnamed protein product [Arabidopsis lyrata]|eukprot:XP_020881845.1 putative L-type lectin-domain containing receptor kinase II.2 [Arabidopsis lyrata subsp. lyrata]